MPTAYSVHQRLIHLHLLLGGRSELRGLVDVQACQPCAAVQASTEVAACANGGMLCWSLVVAHLLPSPELQAVHIWLVPGTQVDDVCCCVTCWLGVVTMNTSSKVLRTVIK